MDLHSNSVNLIKQFDIKKEVYQSFFQLVTIKFDLVSFHDTGWFIEITIDNKIIYCLQ